ncbi:conjugative transposon protein TraK [Chryseobacterium sp. A321]
MIIKTIEQRFKQNRNLGILALWISLFISCAALLFAHLQVRDSRKSLYVLDAGVPILLNQTSALLNREVEYKSQVELFHRLFFTLPPDDEYIQQNIEKSLYLIDDSGKKEYSNLREKGFYNQLISSSSMVSIQVDSIQIDLEKRYFKFYGKQSIQRRTRRMVRLLRSEGYYKDLMRTPQNPHGILLLDWRITDNSELSNETLYGY